MRYKIEYLRDIKNPWSSLSEKEQTLPKVKKSIDWFVNLSGYDIIKIFIRDDKTGAKAININIPNYTKQKDKESFLSKKSWTVYIKNKVIYNF